MSISLARYGEIRDRLVYLYKIIEHRLYTVYVTPSMRMSVDELRDRDEYTQEGFIPDSHYYSEYQPIKLKLKDVIEILPNLINEKDLGFQDANKNVVEIYENIQEYLQLWVELRSKAPEFKIPTYEELRNLESLAYSVFPIYKRIKGYLNNAIFRDNPTTEEDASNYSLRVLEALFGMAATGRNENNQINFISHLDHVDPRASTGLDIPSQLSHLMSDSITSKDVHDLGSWTFKG